MADIFTPEVGFSPAFDEENALESFGGLLAPANAQALRQTPPDSPPQTSAGQTTPQTGSLAVAPSQAQPKVSGPAMIPGVAAKPEDLARSIAQSQPSGNALWMPQPGKMAGVSGQTQYSRIPIPTADAQPAAAAQTPGDLGWRRVLSSQQGTMPSLPAAAQPSVVPDRLNMRTQQDQDKLAQLQAAGPGVNHIKNPLVRDIAKVGDIAGTIFAPRVAAALPGTTLNYEGKVENQEGAVNNDQSQQQARLQGENVQSEINERNARIAAMQNPSQEAAKTITTDQGVIQWNPGTGRYDIPAGGSPDRLTRYQIVTAGDGTMFRIDPADPTHAQPITGPDGKRLTGKRDAKYVQLEGKDGKPHTVEVDDQGNTVKDLGATGEKPTAIKVGSEGTWSLDEDKDGKPILFNSKTGESKDAGGIQKSGTSAKAQAAQQKLIEPVQSAMGYANDYLKNGVFTGSGDEALQEKFFELAKPSTGFRMSQPQIDMLQNARSWMQSAEAKARHALTGTWFSNQQRQQLVQTMNDLGSAKARTLANSGGPQSARPQGSQVNSWPHNIPIPQGQIGVQLKDGTFGHIDPKQRLKFLLNNPGARTF